MKAIRIESWVTAVASGSCGAVPATRVSGIGSSQVISGRASSAPVGSEAGAPRPVGSGRRARLCSAVRQVLVAIWYIHVRSDERPSNPWNARQARM